MIKVLILFTIIVAILTTVNVSVVNLLPDYPYLYIALFLLNLIAIALSSILIKVPADFLRPAKSAHGEHSDEDANINVAEESISVFIKVIIYTLPIVALIGLYFISVLNEGSELAIEDANSWVSFILGIAAFTMALITLWQSEWTYTKIFNALDQLKKDTTEIKIQNDIRDAMSSRGIQLNPKVMEDSPVQEFNGNEKGLGLKDPMPSNQGEVQEGNE